MAGIKNERLEDIGGKVKLTPQEFKAMELIWNYPEGIGSDEIYEKLPFSRSNISTVLYHISEKGYVEKEQEGLHHFYRYTVSRAEYKRAVLRQQMKALNTDSSVMQLVASFYGKEHLTEKQKVKIQELLDSFAEDV